MTSPPRFLLISWEHFCPREDGADRETKTADPSGGKGKTWTEAGHFTAHTSHNRKEDLSGGDKLRLQRGQREEAQKTKPLASVFTMHVQYRQRPKKHFFGSEADMRCR